MTYVETIPPNAGLRVVACGRFTEKIVRKGYGYASDESLKTTLFHVTWKMTQTKIHPPILVKRLIDKGGVMQQKMSILLCVMFTGIVITGCGGTTEKKTWRTIAESGFYQDGGQDFGIVFLFNDISTGEYHLAAKAADKLRNDIGAKEGSDAAIRSRLAFAQKQLDEGAECVALIFAWEKQGSSAPQNPSKPGGPPPKPPKKQVVKFGFPSEDVFQFDILTQQLTINKERKTVRFPGCDGTIRLCFDEYRQ